MINIDEEIQKHQVAINLLKKIKHFDTLKTNAEMTLELIPDNLRVTSKSYMNKIETNRKRCIELEKTYFKFKKTI